MRGHRHGMWEPDGMNRSLLRSPRAWFALILVAYALYAGAFIFKTSALVEQSSYVPQTKRYFVLFDDMMISMRYARHLAEGQGLVWNPGGPRVEGFTNPLWVGYMAIFHWLGIDEALTSLCVQVSGALFILLTLIVVRRLADLLTGDPWAGVGAAIFTGFYLPLNTWSLQGTEVSVLALALTVVAWWTLRLLRAGRFSAGPYLLLGATTWVRPDMAVPFAALALFLALQDRPHRARHVLLAPLILAAFLVPQFLWRRWYFGEWLPNTYTLKMAGYPLVKRVTHGYEIATRFLVHWGALPLGVLVFRRDRFVRLLLWLFAAQMLYSIYVGGDAWEHYGGANRYLSVAIPLWFVLLWAMLRAAYHALARSARTLALPPKPAALRAGLLVSGLYLLVTFNYTYGTGALKEWLLLEPSLYAGENKAKVQQALLLEALTTPDATIALAGVGIVPYFAERTYIDLLGKTDPVIARLPMDQTIIPEFKPGHMKWDYAYSIGTLKPDVVLELWVKPEDAGPYLDADYEMIWFPPKKANVWMRKGSPRILWERIWGG